MWQDARDGLPGAVTLAVSVKFYLFPLCFFVYIVKRKCSSSRRRVAINFCCQMKIHVYNKNMNYINLIVKKKEIKKKTNDLKLTF